MSSTAPLFSWAEARTPVGQQTRADTPAPQAPAQTQPAQSEVYQRRLEQELAAARAELAAMQQLLTEIPQIFERKYQQRLRPILDENSRLTSQLLMLQGAQEPLRLPQLPPAQRPPRFRRKLAELLHADPWRWVTRGEDGPHRAA